MKKINNWSTWVATSTKMLPNFVCPGDHHLHHIAAKFCV
jgi:hypothetical protein